ncbi:hypothetical protein GCM10027037_13990 [Mucilaginibacter koreensis]
MRIPLITACLVAGLSFAVQAQQQVKLSFKYLPNRHYLTKVNMSGNGTVNAQGNSSVADSLKAKGIAPNTTLAVTASADVDITTGAQSGNNVPVTMRLNNVVAQPKINGQQLPVPVGMLNGKAVYATTSATDGQLHIDSVSGKHLPDSTLNRINSMMGMMMNRMQAINKTFKVGESFTQDVKFDMMGGKMKMPENAVTKVTYRLSRVSGTKAYFDIKQSTNFMDNKNGMQSTVTGSGTGSMVYEIKEQYPSSFQSDMNVKVHTADASKGGADVLFNVSTTGTTVLQK